MKLSIDRLIKLIPEWNDKSIKVDQINSGITNINFFKIWKKYFFVKRNHIFVNRYIITSTTEMLIGNKSNFHLLLHNKILPIH